MVRDICSAVQIELPFNRQLDLTRPGNLCEGLKRDPRAERNESGNASDYWRPWIYTTTP